MKSTILSMQTEQNCLFLINSEHKMLALFIGIEYNLGTSNSPS